jgi:hypothetical protein
LVRQYLRIPADWGIGAHSLVSVAERMGKTTNPLGMVRESHIRRGLIYSAVEN